MIIRIWRGTTTMKNANAYESLLKDVVFPGIASKNINGYRGIQLLKSLKENENKVEFITLMGFDNLQSIKDFAGEDHEQSYVVDAAKKLLENYEGKAQHYELLFNDLSFLL